MEGDYLNGDGRSLPPIGALFTAPVPGLKDLHFECFRFPARYLADLDFSCVADLESLSFDHVDFEGFEPSSSPVNLHSLSKLRALSVKDCNGDNQIETAIRWGLRPRQRLEVLFATDQNPLQ